MPFFPDDAQAQYIADYNSRYGHPYAMHHPAANAYAGSFVPLGPILPDPYDQYKSGPAPMGAYDPSSGYINAQHLMAAPYIPPVRMQNRWSGGHAEYGASSRQHGRHTHDKDDKPVGGVSAKLDYEIEQMTDFVTEMTAGIIKPGVPVTPAFRKWVLQVLNATRLPSATIILSLSYMALRVQNLSEGGRFAPTEHSLYQMLTVALILGSKFLDDNTFQNKSWAEVSNISVAELNRDERDWLSSFNHRLHHDPSRASGFNAWLEQWRSFQARSAQSATAPNLHPLDTSVRRQRSIQSGLSSASYNQFYTKPNNSAVSVDHIYSEGSYANPSYSAYEGWYGGRSADRSPSTAPHSGPHTPPDYYGQQAMWSGYDAYSHRQQYALPAISDYSQQPAAYQPGWTLPSFAQAGQGFWNCHGAACQCGSCRAAANMMPARYGSVVVG